MEKSGFQEAERAQLSFLAPLEKKCLLWLAHRMPGWVNSDHLTLLGFLAMFFAGLSYWLASRNPLGLLLVVFWLAVNWFGDSLDGTLARVRNKQRPRYGFYVDKVVDTFSVFFLLGGMMLSGYIHPAIAAGVLIVYLMLTIEVYLATYTIGTFHLSFWKFSPTELRILLSVGNIVLLYRPRVELLGEHYRLLDVGGAASIVGMALMLITAVVRHTRLLYRAEPIA